MAITDSNYAPKHIAINNPLGSKDLFPNKMLTPNTAGDINTQGILIPHIDENPLGYDDIKTIEGKYSFDVGAVTTVYRRGEFPMLFAADANSKPTSTGGDIHVIAEDFDQDISFQDTMLNKLRIASQGSGGNPLAIDDVNNLGGRIIFRTTTPADVTKILACGNGTSTDSTITVNPVTVTPAYDTTISAITAPACPSLDGHKAMIVGWRLNTAGEDSRCAGGLDAQVYITKMSAVLEANYYRKIGYDTQVVATTAGTRIYGYIHEKNNIINQPIQTVHGMFDDIAIKIDGVEYQLHELSVRLYGFFFTNDFKQLFLILDFNYANFDIGVILGTNNIALMEEIKDKSTNISNGYTRMSTHVLLGNFLTVPDAVAQGGDITPANNSGLLYDISVKQNYAQIIQSDQMKISGTYLASQSRMRINQAQKMRDFMMKSFKTKRRNVMLYGKGASKQRDANGQIKQTSAGLFCYQMNPIRYMRHTLNFDSSNRFETIRRFVMNYARSVFAFQPNEQNNGVRNVYISKYMHMLLDEYLKLGQQEQGNITGTYHGMQQNPNNSSYDFKINLTDIATPYGTLRFIVDPGLDYMTENVMPSFMKGVNPKTLLLAIDKSKLSTCVLRAPRLRGNIQLASADYTMEDILSEETFELLDPRSHCVMALDVR